MKKLVIFGSNSFVGKNFIARFGHHFELVPFNRSEFDFDALETVADLPSRISGNIDGILFLQGVNPSKGARDIDGRHFERMLKINLVTPTIILQVLESKLNKGASVLFISSIAKRKGSYDPSYGAAKAALVGLMNSLANSYPAVRFNLLSLGLVKDSPVYNSMTDEIKQRHSSRMFNNEFIEIENVLTMIYEMVNNSNLNRADIALDGGYN